MIRSQMNDIVIGVLALQGAFEEHINLFHSIGIKSIEIKFPNQFNMIHAIVLPGGESTTIAKIAHDLNLIEPLKKWVADRKPIWGTCAGMIMLSNTAKRLKQGGQELIGGLDIDICRNYFGAQVNSFQMNIEIPNSLNDLNSKKKEFPAIFIRAPAILSVGSKVDILIKINYKNKDVIVAAKNEHILVTAFHPELSDNTSWHRYFIENFIQK